MSDLIALRISIAGIETPNAELVSLVLAVVFPTSVGSPMYDNICCRLIRFRALFLETPLTDNYWALWMPTGHRGQRCVHGHSACTRYNRRVPHYRISTWGRFSSLVFLRVTVLFVSDMG